MLRVGQRKYPHDNLGEAAPESVAANVASLTIECAPDGGAGVHIETGDITMFDQLGHPECNCG